MLKDKSCYANSRVYAMNYFFHKAGVKDFCVDPMLGSFIRVITPPADMPAEAADMYKKSQFMFMTRSDRSRLYDLKDARPLVDAIYNLCEQAKSPTPVLIPMQIKDCLEIDDFGHVQFKDTDGRWQRLLASPPRPNVDRGINNDLLTLERYIDGLDNLHHGLKCALTDEGISSPVIQIGNELMFTMHRPDQKVTVPVVVTARKFPSRKDQYIILHSNNQRMVFPADKAADMFERYFDRVIGISEDLLKNGKVGDGEVNFIYNKPGVIDENMEYVNIRVVDYESGPNTHVMMNSDRYPGNTKFSFLYDREFVKEFRDRLIDFAKRFEEIDVEKVPTVYTGAF